MITVYYSRTKLVMRGAFLLLGTPLAGMICLLGDPIAMLFGLGLIVSGPLLSAGRLGRLFGDLKAIEYDDWNINLYPLGAARRLRWRDVTGIEMGIKLRTFYGLFPLGWQQAIHFTHSRDKLGRTGTIIPVALLLNDKTALAKRLEDMEKRLGGGGFIKGADRISHEARASAFAAPNEHQAPVGKLDADAMIARSAARGRAQGDVPVPLPHPASPQIRNRTAGFGRKRT